MGKKPSHLKILGKYANLLLKFKDWFHTPKILYYLSVTL